MELNTVETWLKRRTVYLQSSHNEYNDSQDTVAVKSTHSFVCVLQGESSHKSSYNQDEAQHLECDMEIKPGRIPYFTIASNDCSNRQKHTPPR